MMTRASRGWLGIPALIVALSALFHLSCEQLPSGPARASTSALRGFALTEWSHDGYSSGSAGAAITRIRSLGSTHLMLLSTAYQDSRGSSTVGADSSLTPTLSSLRDAAAAAASEGLLLAVKPHVDIRDGTGRSLIDPEDPTRWFESYREFLLPLAELAESVGAVQFVIGTELAGTLEHEAEWSRTISMVRTRFTGAITYAASWDEAALVPFWDEVDLVGIDAYFPITVRRDAGRFEILSGWQLWLDRLEHLHRQTGKPVLLTEIGYRSVDGAGTAPYDFQSVGPVDAPEQADLYWGATEAFGALDWVAGMFWWNVRPDGPVGADNVEYSPLGKPAEQELRMSWGRP